VFAEPGLAGEHPTVSGVPDKARSLCHHDPDQDAGHSLDRHDEPAPLRRLSRRRSFDNRHTDGKHCRPASGLKDGPTRRDRAAALQPRLEGMQSTPPPSRSLCLPRSVFPPVFLTVVLEDEHIDPRRLGPSSCSGTPITEVRLTWRHGEAAARPA
jgi:hypothetical protein